MSPFEKRKLENAICYFARRHKERTGKSLYQTYLYKYLAFTDYFILRETGAPAFDLEYRAWEYGPVPIQLYEARNTAKTDLYSFEVDLDNGTERIRIEAFGDPDLDYFTELEIKIMEKMIFQYANDYATTAIISEHSHDIITAWQVARSEPWPKRMNHGENFTEADKGSLSSESYQFRRAYNDYRSGAGTNLTD